MNYPVVLHKDKNSDYGVTVPDLPGCFSAGETLDEALAMAKEAIEVYLETLIEQGTPIPEPGDLEIHKRNRDYRGGTWAIITLDRSSLRVKAKRINITVPERVLDAMDRFAKEHGDTRSGLIVQAVAEYMGRANDRAMARAKRGRSIVSPVSRPSQRKAG